MRVRWIVAVVLLFSLGACSADAPADNASPMTASSDAAQDKPDGSLEGRTNQGRSGSDLSGLQGGAASAAELVESGDGLRVENTTADPVILVLADGATAQVDVGKVVTLHMPCRERFPLRAESTTGQLIAERDGPCLRRDTWTLD